ncbi:MAG: methyltransferase domain-containing protein [Candidatus Jorgensenbacteria bacterium]
MIALNKEKLKVYLYIVREIAVNLIGYKLGIRKLMRKGAVVNTNCEDMDGVFNDKISQLDFIKTWGESLQKKPFPCGNVLEIGPGGTLLLGSMLIAEGCKEYYGIDAFPSLVWGKFATALYGLADRKLPEQKAEKVRTALSLSKNKNGPIKYFGNVGVENIIADRCVEPKSIDLIYSWGVLEHVPSPENAFNVLRKVIRDDGIAIHVIEPSPHTWKRFSNPYVIFCIPDWLWGLMYHGRNFQNRFRASDYVGWARNAGFDVIEAENTEIGKKDHLSIRGKFTERFKSYSDEDILTGRLTLILKPSR